MAALIYLITGAGGLMYYAYAKQQMTPAALPEEKMVLAHTAPINHIGSLWGSQEMSNGRFKSAVEIVDERGAQAWLVDFGNFSQTIMYRDPSIQVA